MTNPNKPAASRPAPIELLAPAGNSDSFHAAIDAGADAVYLGLDMFNARLRARNFTLDTLAALLPYARSRSVKVYVTLNTLIKESEIRPLQTVLQQLLTLQVDGLIVADLGLIRIVRRYFPDLPLHGSTQMFLHNLPALELAAHLGLTRAILPREMTMEEVAFLVRESPIGIEIFVHGALCYSFSGQCLASSFLGGAGGNRGRCTQVCRRRFESEAGSGAFFSPRDLQTVELIPQFIQMGITSLKIEGRMRSPEYVFTVVNAYRRAIDSPEKIPALTQELAMDMGRSKTRFFLAGIAQKDIIESRETGTGFFLGVIDAIDEREIKITSGIEIFAGDQIRIHPQNGFEGTSVTITFAALSTSGISLVIPHAQRFTTGDSVYLTSRKSVRDCLAQTRHRIPYKTNSHSPGSSLPPRLPDLRHSRTIPTEPSSLFIRIDSLDLLDLIPAQKCDGVILNLTREETARFIKSYSGKRMPGLPFFLTMPSFVAPHDVAEWKRLIDRSVTLRPAGWFCGHPAQLDLIPKQMAAFADATANILNSQSQILLSELGFSGFTLSLEDDFPNMRGAGAQGGFMQVYGRIPLFVSRIMPTIAEQTVIRDTRGDRFFPLSRHGLFYLISADPVSLFAHVDKMETVGVRRFVIDLSFAVPGTLPDTRSITALVDQFHRREKIGNIATFNFKRGLQ